MHPPITNKKRFGLPLLTISIREAVDDTLMCATKPSVRMQEREDTVRWSAHAGVGWSNMGGKRKGMATRVKDRSSCKMCGARVIRPSIA